LNDLGLATVLLLSSASTANIQEVLGDAPSQMPVETALNWSRIDRA
jgi:hypothetical protein